MRKLYDGYATPGMVRVRYRLEWRCPKCRSEKVCLDPTDTRELRWCDGGPCTEDSMRYWVCSHCGTRTRGSDMKVKRRNVKITEKELREEALQSQEFLQQFSRLLDTLEPEKKGS